MIPGARDCRRATMAGMEHANAEPAQTGWWRLGALAVGGFAVAEVLVAFALVPAAGFGWSRALTSFLATNGLMGFAFATSGLLIAWFRPRHPLGWLLVAAGLAHATSALMAPVAEILDANDGPLALLRAVVTVYMFAWPWSIALFLPMALLLFPDGHLPSPRWRYAAWAIVLTAPLFVLEMVTGTEPVAEGMPLGYLAFDTDGLDWLWTLSEVRTLAALLVAVAALVVRYRRAGETERAQLLWLLMAGIVVVVAVAPWSFVAGTPIAVLFAIPLVPARDRCCRRTTSAARHPVGRLPRPGMAAALGRRTHRLCGSRCPARQLRVPGIRSVGLCDGARGRRAGTPAPSPPARGRPLDVRRPTRPCARRRSTRGSPRCRRCAWPGRSGQWAAQRPATPLCGGPRRGGGGGVIGRGSPDPDHSAPARVRRRDGRRARDRSAPG